MTALDTLTEFNQRIQQLRMKPNLREAQKLLQWFDEGGFESLKPQLLEFLGAARTPIEADQVTFWIPVKLPNGVPAGTEIKEFVPINLTVGQVKKLLQSTVGLPVDQITLDLNGALLQDDQNFAQEVEAFYPGFGPTPLILVYQRQQVVPFNTGRVTFIYPGTESQEHLTIRPGTTVRQVKEVLARQTPELIDQMELYANGRLLSDQQDFLKAWPHNAIVEIRIRE